MLTELSPQDVHDRLQAGAIRLIDIRESDEYRSLSVAGAELMPLSTLGRYPLQKGLPVVFTCRSGRRTRDNAPLLESLAQGEAFMLRGGLGSLLWGPLLWLAGFVGAGLIFAGVTGFCGLGMLLKRLPWNRRGMACACGRQ